MRNCFFYEVFKEEEKKLRQFLPPAVKAGFSSQTIQESGHLLPPAKLISIRTQSEIPDEWALRLNGILSRTTGCDHLLAYRRRTKTKMPLGYLPSYCSRAVAEQAILMMLALLRKLPSQVKQFDRFLRDGITGRECLNKNLLVVGVGRIGSEVVEIAKGLKMNVKGEDIVRRHKNVTYVSLKAGLSWADVAVCSLPLTPTTKGMLNYKAFRQAKKGIVFINVARGEISPTKDLKRLLDEGRLGALGMDVFEDEPFLAESLRVHKNQGDERIKTIKDLRRRKNVLMTPHNAFNTLESVERKARQGADAIKMFLEKKTFPELAP